MAAQAGGPVTAPGGGRETSTAAVERLDAYARGTDPAAVAATADEIIAVAQLLAGQPRLRRALSDPGRAGGQRAELLGGLLSGKVGDACLELLTTLVTGRWAVPSELLDATERLGVEALLASAEHAGDLAEVEDELFRFRQVTDGDTRLAATLSDSSVPPARRAALARDLLADKAEPVTVRLVELALAGFAGRNFAGALTRLVELAAQRRDRQVAYVTVATPLTEAEEQRLGAALRGLYGREVALKVTVDPGVLGGMRLRVGHDLYDGTVLRRLAHTRNALVGKA